MITDNRKSLIAHELGHALVAAIFDKGYKPTTIVLKGKKGEGGRAFCNLDETGRHGNTSLAPIRKMYNLVDLGGIFGELAWHGEWSPWGASADLEDFMATNSHLKNRLKTELWNWMYNDEDDESFYDLIRQKKDIIGKRNTTLTWFDTICRLPELWEVYIDFVEKIDLKTFKDVVVELDQSKLKTISAKRVEKYIERIRR